MHPNLHKEFNDVFLSEISSFDSRKYARDVFFNCDHRRFQQIAHAYGNQCGTGALNYMLRTHHAWKSGSVSPNGSSCYNIVASTAATFTIEEKFVEAYTQLARHVKSSFPRRIKIPALRDAFSKIIAAIDSFNLAGTTYYAKYIYRADEMADYQTYVKNVFKFYGKTIFDDFQKDIPLFRLLYKHVNTSFLKASFRTFLFNIEICVRETDVHLNHPAQAFVLNPPITYDGLLSNKILTFSLSKVLQIASAKESVKANAAFTVQEIETLVAFKNKMATTKAGGSVDLHLKTNSGLLNLNLRILSPNEKAVVLVRAFAFFVITFLLVQHFIIGKRSYLAFVALELVSLSLIVPIWQALVDLTKDAFRK